MKKWILMIVYVASFAIIFGGSMFGVWLFDLIISNLGYWWTVTMFAVMGCIRLIATLTKDYKPIEFLSS